MRRSVKLIVSMLIYLYNNLDLVRIRWLVALVRVSHCNHEDRSSQIRIQWEVKNVTRECKNLFLEL